MIDEGRAVVTIRPRADRTADVDSGKRERKQESALRGFNVSPAFVVQIAPSFALWNKNPAPSWMELLDTTTMVRHELGISQHAWGQACEALGRIEAIVMLAAIDARRSAGEVQSPGGLLRKMVELHRGGTLRLDKTLFGLADKLKARMH